MKIDVIKPISFCEGVKRSISMIEQIVKDNKNSNIFCLGKPVHNEQISEYLKTLGVVVIDTKPSEYESELKKLSANDIIIFSAHGHDKNLDAIAQSKKLICYDTICPIVKKINEDINKKISNEKNIIYLGKTNHAESYAIYKSYKQVVFWDISSSILVDFVKKDTFYDVYNQTTILENKLEPIYNKLRKYENLNIINTSCPYVSSKFNYIKNNIKNYDYFLVLGSKLSSNTAELYEFVLNLYSSTQTKTVFVNSKDDLKALNIKKDCFIAISSGTSTPVSFVEEIISILKSKE